MRNSWKKDSKDASVSDFFQRCSRSHTDKHSRKREHLLGQIQSQAAEIERLIQELEKVTSASKGAQGGPDQIDTSGANNLLSPVLSPSTASGAFFGSDEHSADVIDDDGHPQASASNSNNPAVNKAVEDWISKARESLHEFGTFIGIGGAGMPTSYLVDEDFEESESSEDDFVDVQEDLEEQQQFGNEDDQYRLAVQDPNGAGMAYREGAPTPPQHLRHHSSNSSIGTTATGVTAATTGTSVTTSTNARPKKMGNNEGYEKPATLPAVASPFGMFGSLSLGGPKSRDTSVEPGEEDKQTGIANDEFFKPSKDILLSFIIVY